MQTSSNKEFGTKDYWERRFQEEKSYDWLASYSDLELQFKQTLTKYNLQKTAKILIIGCGNSTLSVDLHSDGFTNLVSMDYSENVIKNMQQLYPKLEWVVSDILEMKEFENNSFDIVIEKGVIDVLMVDEKDVWNPEESVKIKVNKTLTEIKRILKNKNSLFLSISFQQPHFRKKYLIPKDSIYSEILDEKNNYYKWEYSLVKIEKGLDFFMYVQHFSEK